MGRIPGINHLQAVRALEKARSRIAIRGLRYPVETVLELLSSGMSIEEILADYEDLEREDILTVPAFAARLIQVKRIERVVT